MCKNHAFSCTLFIKKLQGEFVMRRANTKEASETKPFADYFPNNQAHYSPQIDSSLQSTSAKYIAGSM